VSAEWSAERQSGAGVDLSATRQKRLAGAAGFEPADAGTKNRTERGVRPNSLRNELLVHRPKSMGYVKTAEGKGEVLPPSTSNQNGPMRGTNHAPGLHSERKVRHG